ncbi:MAG: hypothetical protein HY000_28395 [Planctomycetes bacterium]|nr:hypothetical protein [Planctomycetota bacterium]
MISRLRASGWRGQITGPHGSGKSTLLAALVPALREAGRRVELITLHDGQRRLPLDLVSTPELDAAAMIVVDGYEQLSRWSRLRLRRLCTRRGWGLLVTAHADVGLPQLFQTKVTDQLAAQIIRRLQQPASAGGSLRDALSASAATADCITYDEITAILARNGGNMRETLFTLYDLYELRRRRTDSQEYLTLTRRVSEGAKRVRA